MASIKYLPFLIKEIITSAIFLSKSIWLHSVNNSKFTTINVEDMNDSMKVIYACSITLTPGTFSLEIDSKQKNILVHSFDYQGNESFEKMKFKLKKL